DLAQTGRELLDPDGIAGPFQEAVGTRVPVLAEVFIAVDARRRRVHVLAELARGPPTEMVQPAIETAQARPRLMEPGGGRLGETLKRTAATWCDDNGTATPAASSSRTGSSVARNIRT